MKKDKKALDDLDAEFGSNFNPVIVGIHMPQHKSFEEQNDYLMEQGKLNNARAVLKNEALYRQSIPADVMDREVAKAKEILGIHDKIGDFVVTKVEERTGGPISLTMTPDPIITEDAEAEPWFDNKKLTTQLSLLDDNEKLINSTAKGLYGADLIPSILPTVLKYKHGKLDENDLFSKDERKYPLTVDEATPKLLQGADIIRIRELTGKARNTAIEQLYSQTVKHFEQASKECFYVPHDVRSSKNSKEIGRFKKRNHEGKLEDFTTLVESKAAKAYRKTTAGYWLQNKVEFLNQTRHLPLPLRIEFTFIRETLIKFDFVNGAQILCDMMVEYGYMPDDETCYIVPVFGHVFYHNKLAGVLIKVIK